LSVPIFDAALRVAVKCDFCLGAPECVTHCSSGALRVYPRDEAARFNERLYLSVKEDR
jgi:Fe-S-cluster-containing hydrogenase component 2